MMPWCPGQPASFNGRNTLVPRDGKSMGKYRMMVNDSDFFCEHRHGKQSMIRLIIASLEPQNAAAEFSSQLCQLEEIP